MEQRAEDGDVGAVGKDTITTAIQPSILRKSNPAWSSFLSSIYPQTTAMSSKGPSGGTSADPIVLSSDDEEEVPEVPSKKKRRLADRDRSETSSNDTTFHFEGTRAFCLILIVEPDDECRQLLRRCRQNCDPAVHEHCFQKEGTLHFTLSTFDGKKGTDQLFYDEATRIAFDTSKLPLPTLNLTGYKNWTNCVALTTDTSIIRLVNGLSGISPPLSPYKVENDLHCSLYRVRLDKDRGELWNGSAAKKRREEFNRVRQHINGSFGKAKGVRIVLKEIGADYFGRDGKFFRVIAE